MIKSNIDEKDKNEKEKEGVEDADNPIIMEKFKKVISLEDPIYTIKTFLYLYGLMKVVQLLGDRFILLIAMNVFIFYAPINKKIPNFLFITRMYIKQIIEGSIGIIECLIPRYEEEKKKK